MFFDKVRLWQTVGLRYQFKKWVIFSQINSNASKFQFDLDVGRFKHELLARETGRPRLTVLEVK